MDMNKRLAAWLVYEVNLLGNGIWGTWGFDTEQEAMDFAKGRPSFQVRPAGEVRYWLA